MGKRLNDFNIILNINEIDNLENLMMTPCRGFCDLVNIVTEFYALE